MNTEKQNMRGKVCMVTGATAGIGQATALLLARQGATFVGVGRNLDKNKYSTELIKQATGNSAVEYLLADLSSQKDIHTLVEQFESKYNHLDVLVNNAGSTFGERMESLDGVEMTFALNHLGYFLITNLLWETLVKSAPARVINVSSGLHRLGKINFNDIAFHKGYARLKAYRRSKLANICFTYELARRKFGQDVTVNAMNPGLVATNVGEVAGGLAARMKALVDRIAAMTPEEGARTIIYLATSPEVEGVTGRYFVKERSVPSSKITYDLAICERLWEVSESMIDPEYKAHRF